MTKHVKSPEWAAEDVTSLITKASNYLYRDKKFRQAIDSFNEMDQTEQDRIFNEIVVSGIVLAILTFEHLANLAQNEEKKSYFFELKTETESRYSNVLRELNIEEEFAQLWKKLIGMRAAEYHKDYADHESEFEGAYGINPWMFVVAIGGTDHISRGRAAPDSELFRLFRGWVFNLSEKIFKVISK